jgi:hypothetical protein
MLGTVLLQVWAMLEYMDDVLGEFRPPDKTQQHVNLLLEPMLPCLHTCGPCACSIGSTPVVQYVYNQIREQFAICCVVACIRF